MVDYVGCRGFPSDDIGTIEYNQPNDNEDEKKMKMMIDPINYHYNMMCCMMQNY